MKKGSLVIILILIVLVLSINLVFADLIKDTNIISFPKVVKPNQNKLVSSAVISPIIVEYPEAGYYYITDEMLVWITTTNPSTCTYTFNSQTKNMIDNSTDHYEFISGLTDNMASDIPYIVDFSCNDGVTTETAETYFWINTTDLDKYLIRSDLGNLNYLNSEYYYDENDSYALGSYRAYYKKNNGLYNSFVVKVYDSKATMEKYLGSDNETITTIGNNNFYSYRNSDYNILSWTSNNFLIVDVVFAYKNTTSISLDIPNDTLSPYLSKYPSDLRSGVCGDGKVNILNLDGKKEQCDKNSEMVSCGSIIGECKIGKKLRKCNSDCTWGSYGACNDTKPKTEICDGKDNDCDNKIDEDFLTLGKSCSEGIGECANNGVFICKPDGSGVKCDTIKKNSSKEICSDNKDNDCDGKIDFNDPLDCIPLRILSPIQNKNYSNKNILVDIFSSYDSDEIIYSYKDNKNKDINVKICSKCNSFNKTKSFKDGFYNLTFELIKNKEIKEKKQISFLVDSTLPKITETLPKKGFTNGNFSIKFKEENPKNIILHYDSTKKTANIKTDCQDIKGIKQCFVKPDLSSFDGKKIDYYFEIEDISGNKASSKPISLIVDTKVPVLKMNYTIDKGKVDFIFNVTELNFKEITYIDSSETKPKEVKLCTKLKNGFCEVKKSFKIGSHNLTISVNDLAGNQLKKDLKIVI